jgi:hypothetical protein
MEQTGNDHCHMSKHQCSLNQTNSCTIDRKHDTPSKAELQTQSLSLSFILFVSVSLPQRHLARRPSTNPPARKASNQPTTHPPTSLSLSLVPHSSFLSLSLSRSSFLSLSLSRSSFLSLSLSLVPRSSVSLSLVPRS